jgi:mono/diheme cytochrome c family protein
VSIILLGFGILCFHPGCGTSGGGNGDMTGDPPVGIGVPDGQVIMPGEILTVFPDTVYTAVTETQHYTVPFVLSRNEDPVTGARVTSADPSVATAAAGPDDYLITGVTQGQTTIVASSQGDTVTVMVNVVAYSDAQVTQGMQVYMTQGCGGCHDGAGQPDLTSSGLGQVPEDEIAAAITTGKSPGGDPISVAHSFPVNGADLSALVAYLRSLPPRGLPSQGG